MPDISFQRQQKVKCVKSNRKTHIFDDFIVFAAGLAKPIRIWDQ